jgi:hypothetical protein
MQLVVLTGGQYDLYNKLNTHYRYAIVLLK